MLNLACPQNDSSRYIADGFINYFFSWYIVLANLTATVFSGLCFFVLIKHPRVFASSTRAWFMAITVSDFFTLLLAANDMYAEVMFPMSYHRLLFKVFGRYNCMVRLSLILSLGWSSNLLQTGLSLERLASVIAPLKTRALTTGRLTRFTILGIIIFSCGIAIGVNILSYDPKYMESGDTQEEPGNEMLLECDRVNGSTLLGEMNVNLDLTKIVYHIDLIMFRAIPFGTMLVSSAIIASLIRCQRRRRTKLMGANSVLQQRQLYSGSNHESQASLLLLTMNLTTLITNPLFLIFELIDGEGSEGRTSGKLTGNTCVTWVLRQIFNCLLYFNNQTNWIFYIAFGARFRHHIVTLFRCRHSGSIHERQTKRSHTITTRNTTYHSVKRVSGDAAVYGERMERVR
ncbi:Rhodopsin orphan GPCR [Fasciola hepatica]|uniref:Rhodopsin orphan GPCR n=1 Tax=Fasciola hepatica TaxID=6192 RepID=A0A2H1CRY9_FASHE|nr:Rhodopsin orphan GPCR [Fasciola hepatica]